MCRDRLQFQLNFPDRLCNLWSWRFDASRRATSETKNFHTLQYSNKARTPSSISKAQASRKE
eukprot:3992368-Amphidinium_carterae.1